MTHPNVTIRHFKSAFNMLLTGAVHNIENEFDDPSNPLCLGAVADLLIVVEGVLQDWNALVRTEEFEPGEEVRLKSDAPSEIYQEHLFGVTGIVQSTRNENPNLVSVLFIRVNTGMFLIHKDHMEKVTS